jgi:AraC-like DNA-binding protein
VVQQSSLRISSVAVDSPALILLRHGSKTLSSGTRRWCVEAGQGIVVSAGQVLDIENRLSAEGHFEARWVVWCADLLAFPDVTYPSSRELAGAIVLPKLSAAFASAIDRAVEAISDVAAVPSAVAAHRMTELLVWLRESGIRLAPGKQASTTARLRGLVAAAPASSWSVAAAAHEIATSQATLRRRLLAEGTSFNEIVTDARMSTALTLLQSTQRPVADIAADVGYESPSRFAVRFKRRFGFAPSVVRGHAR